MKWPGNEQFGYHELFHSLRIKIIQGKYIENIEPEGINLDF